MPRNYSFLFRSYRQEEVRLYLAVEFANLLFWIAIVGDAHV